MRKLVAPLSFRGRIEFGVLEYDRPKYFKGMLNNLENVDVRVIIEPVRGAKSNRQLGYLFGVVYTLLAEHTGHTVDEIDRIMKGKYLTDKILWRGSEIVTAKGKAELNHLEMEEFISQVVQEAREMGVEIPEPDREFHVHEQFPESR